MVVVSHHKPKVLIKTANRGHRNEMQFTVAFLVGVAVGIMSSFCVLGIINAIHEKRREDCYKKIGRGGTD